MVAGARMWRGADVGIGELAQSAEHGRPVQGNVNGAAMCSLELTGVRWMLAWALVMVAVLVIAMVELCLMEVLGCVWAFLMCVLRWFSLRVCQLVLVLCWST